MTTQRVTKQEIENTLHNINVLLYAVEEALAAAGRDPESLPMLKISLCHLTEEVKEMRIEQPIEFVAPTPAFSLLR